jgi:DNA-binding MarR family transcriptional regulator
MNHISPEPIAPALHLRNTLRAMMRQTQEDLTLRQWAVLLTLAEAHPQGEDFTAVREAADIPNSPGLTRSMERLAFLGLATAQISAGDRRRRTLRLTEAGLAAVQAVGP